MLRARVEGARLGLWKRVIGSRVLLWGFWLEVNWVAWVVVDWGRGSYKAEHLGGWVGIVVW